MVSMELMRGGGAFMGTGVAGGRKQQTVGTPQAEQRRYLAKVDLEYHKVHLWKKIWSDVMADGFGCGFHNEIDVTSSAQCQLRAAS
jgi:hypothetical protein